MDKKKVIGFNQFVKMGSVDMSTAESLYVSYIKRSYGINENISISEAKKIQQKSKKKLRDSAHEKYQLRKRKERDKYEF